METDPEPSVSASSVPLSAPPQQPIDESLRPLSVRITATDVTTHLDGLVRQKGGVGSSGYDEKQKDIRAFFGGGGGR